MSVLRSVLAVIAGGALALGCGGDAADCNCPATPPRGCVYTGRQGCLCAAMVCSDSGPVIDVRDAAADARADAGTDLGREAGFDAGADAGFDAGADVGFDAGADVGFDAGADVGFDAGADVGFDVGADVGFDVGFDAGADVGFDVGFDAGADVGRDVPVDQPGDAARPPCPAGPTQLDCATNSDCSFGIYPVSCNGRQRAVAFRSNPTPPFSLIVACWREQLASMPSCALTDPRIQLGETPNFVAAGTVLGAACLAGQCQVVEATP